MLKKINLLLLCLLGTILSGLKVNAYTGNGFIWNKTELDVLINTPFDEYLDELDIKFYYNGELTDNEVTVTLDEMIYGNMTIDTSTIENKTVRLVAKVKGYSTYDARDILVHIVDHENPVITLTKALEVNVGDSFNYNDYFNITDNDKLKSIVVNTEKINTSVVGNYPLTISATDNYGNTTSLDYNLYVVDKEIPVIQTASFIEVAYGNLDFDITKYVVASDEVDGDLTQNVRIEGLNIFSLGEQTVSIYVSDSTGNVRTVTKTIKVVDNEAPTLELDTYYQTLDITNTNIDFTKYIKKASDNCDNLDIDNVIIDTSDYSAEIGSHLITYRLIDSSNNYTIRVLNLTYTYSSSPKIVAENLTINQYDHINLKDYFTATDLYDENINENLSIDSSVLDTSTPGIYEVVLSVTNSAGLTSTKSVYITVLKKQNTASKNMNSIKSYIYQNKTTIVLCILLINVIVLYFAYKKKRNSI